MMITNMMIMPGYAGNERWLATPAQSGRFQLAITGFAAVVVNQHQQRTHSRRQSPPVARQHFATLSYHAASAANARQPLAASKRRRHIRTCNAVITHAIVTPQQIYRQTILPHSACTRRNAALLAPAAVTAHTTRAARSSAARLAATHSAARRMRRILRAINCRNRNMRSPARFARSH